jgi:hypothetical protein
MKIVSKNTFRIHIVTFNVINIATIFYKVNQTKKNTLSKIKSH